MPAGGGHGLGHGHVLQLVASGSEVRPGGPNLSAAGSALTSHDGVGQWGNPRGADIARWLIGVAGQPVGESLRGRRGLLGLWLVGEKQQGQDLVQVQSGQDCDQGLSGVVRDSGSMLGLIGKDQETCGTVILAWLGPE